MKPTVRRLILGGLFFLMGPALLAVYGYHRWTYVDTMTAKTTATVVRIKEYQGGGNSRSECAVYSWQIDDRTVEAESNYCDVVPAVGDSVEIRYDPNDIDEVIPAIEEAEHDEAVPIVIATLLCTLISGFFLWPRRQR